MPEIVFAFEGDDQTVAANTRSLTNWLNDTESLAQAVVTERKRPVRPGEMGGGIMAVAVLAASAPVLNATVTAYVNWMIERLRTGAYTVRITCSEGGEITATVRSLAEVRRVERSLRRSCVG